MSKKLNLIRAAVATRRLILSAPAWPAVPTHLERLHLSWMLDQIEREVITGEKAHYWLGWAQAGLFSAGFCTMEDLKRIRREALEKV